MTKYLVEEIVTPGYSIDRGVYDNPKDAQYRAMEIFVEGIIEENIKIREVPLLNSFTFKGVTYEVIPNGNHFTVVDEDGFAMVSIKNEFDAETALKEHVIHCEELYRRAL